MSSASLSRVRVLLHAPSRRVLPTYRAIGYGFIQFAPRNASTKPSGKPIVLEKPDKFRPPSHAARLPRKIRNYGPALSEQEREQQNIKRYPHMMPPEGSFLHDFLTAKWLHAWIAMSVLFSLAGYMFLQDFLHTTPYADLLPPKSELLSHPFSTISQFVEVYKMHTAYISAQTAERRRKKVEDVQKRAEYRKAHGLDDQQSLFGWSLKGEEGTASAATVPDTSNEEQSTGSNAEYVDFEGRKKKPVKKWFGIWE